MFPSIQRRRPRPPATKKKARKRVHVDADSWQSVKDAAEGTNLPDRLHVQTWLDSFRTEAEQYSSITACAEVFYARVVGATENSRDPDVLRTSASMMLLEEVTSIFGRYRPLVSSLCAQLYAGIYILPDAETIVDRSSFDDPAGESALNSRYARKTYFCAYQELSVVHTATEERANVAERCVHTLWEVMARAIRAWQVVLLRATFASWRGAAALTKRTRREQADHFKSSVHMTRTRRAIRNWVNSVQHTRRVLEEAGVTAASTITERLEAEKRSLEDEVCALRHMLEARDVKIAVLQQENRALKIEKKELVEKYVTTQRSFTKLSGYVARWLADLSSPPHDHDARRCMQGCLHSAESGFDFLLSWAKALILKHCGEEGRITDFMVEVRTGKPYIYLLRALAPAQCSEGWAIRCVSEANTLKRCEFSISMAKRLGVRTPLQPQDVLNASYEQNFLHLALCFHRFATPSASLHSSEIPRLWDDSPILTKPNIKPPDLTTPDDWQKQWTQVTAHNRLWEDKATEIVNSVQHDISEALRTGARKALTSRRDAELLSPYYDFPIASYADLLATINIPLAEAHESIRNSLKSHAPALRKVFKFYSARDGDSYGVESEAQVQQTMSFIEYEAFCDDCGVEASLQPDPNGLCSRLRLTNITSVTNKFEVTRLGPSEFALGVLRIAEKTFTDEDITERVRRFVLERMEPYARSSSVDSFRETLLAPDLQQTLLHHREQLLQLFTECSGADCGSVQLQAWEDFAQKYDIYDVVTDQEVLTGIFHGVQDDDDDGTALTLEYKEFVEALVALAVLKFPHPFEPLSRRVLRFMKNFLKF